ncbi:MAG: glycerol-3-phosphate 1-O-acyltransferase PlsY [Cocleimonas sp.]
MPDSVPTFLPILLVVASYFVGSASAAIITCKLMGKEDPRSLGSKNPGATNVMRFAGKKAAFFTLLGDLFKGLIPIAIGHALDLSWGWLVLIGIAAFLGHLYPIYYGFKGGKGVATALGIYFGLNPIIGAVVGVTWLISSLLFNMSSLSALIACLLAPLYYFWVTGSIDLFLGLVFIAVFIYWSHRGNIVKIIDGTESKISKK